MLHSEINLELPVKCIECGSVNFKLHGCILNDDLMVEWRCIRCGKIIIKIKDTINHNL